MDLWPYKDTVSFYTKSFYDALYWGFCIVLLRMSGFRKLDHNYCISDTPDTRNSTNLWYYLKIPCLTAF